MALYTAVEQKLQTKRRETIELVDFFQAAAIDPPRCVHCLLPSTMDVPLHKCVKCGAMRHHACQISVSTGDWVCDKCA